MNQLAEHKLPTNHDNCFSAQDFAFIAAQEGNLDMVKLLIQHGADHREILPRLMPQTSAKKFKKNSTSNNNEAFQHKKSYRPPHF